MSSAGIIAIAVIVAFVLLCGFAMWKYTADEAIKVMGIFVPIFAAVIGSIATYYFTKDQVATARAQAADYKAQASTYATDLSQTKAQLADVRRESLVFAKTVAETPDNVKLGELKSSPQFKAALEAYDFNKEPQENAAPPPK